MKPEDCKILTKWMGEKVLRKCDEKKRFRNRFDCLNYINPTTGETILCKDCPYYKQTLNRTFDTPQDMYDVFKLLVDRGKWNKFFNWYDDLLIMEEAFLSFKDLFALLMYDPSRFIELVLQAIKEGVI